MATRIKEKYLAEAIPALEEKFGYKNGVWATARTTRKPWKWLLTN